MNSPILVAYATRYGSTREVAETIGRHLREAGQVVSVMPAGEVSSLDGFGAVVLGAPFYIGQMLPDARKFMERHRESLGRMPVAVFALGPIRASDDRLEARKQLDGALGKMAWLKVAAAEMFVGKYDPRKLNFVDGLVGKLPASPLYRVGAHDERDWDAIRAWAVGLPAALAAWRHAG